MKDLQEYIEKVNAAYAEGDGYALTWAIREMNTAYGAEITLEHIPGDWFVAREEWVDDDNYRYVVVIDREYEIDVYRINGIDE